MNLLVCPLAFQVQLSVWFTCQLGILFVFDLQFKYVSWEVFQEHIVKEVIFYLNENGVLSFFISEGVFSGVLVSS